MAGFLACVDFLLFVAGTLFVADVCFDIARIAVSMYDSPFVYPHFETKVDVSRKRQPDKWDVVDHFLCDADNRDVLRDYARRAAVWEAEQMAFLTVCRLPFRRLRQYSEAIGCEPSCRFDTVREQTRYRQSDYVRIPYTVVVPCDTFRVRLETLVKRNEQLAAIGYEATLREYNAKDQRRLMTPELRRQIMERDGYTCQICGRYMPDGNDIHIDHIRPVSKGGKTVPSNLQVLCAKCNLSKGAKVIEM